MTVVLLAATAAPAASKSLVGVFVWSGVLIGLSVLGFVGYSLLRRWMTGGGDTPSQARGFTLGELRDLHRRGELSDEEYAATKAQLIGAAKQAIDKMPPVLPRRPTRPADEAPDDTAT